MAYIARAERAARAPMTARAGVILRKYQNRPPVRVGALIKFFRSQFFGGFPQCFCAVARKSLGLQDVFGAKTPCWSGVCAAPAGGRIPRENAISGMISRISAKGGKREISDVGRWRAPAAAANEDNSDEWPSATTAAILCATTIAPPPGTWSASQASGAPPRSCLVNWSCPACATAAATPAA